MLRPVMLTACVLALSLVARIACATRDSELMAPPSLEGIRAGADCSDFGVTGAGCAKCFAAPGPGGFYWQCNIILPSSDCTPITGPCVACTSSYTACPGVYAGYLDSTCNTPSAPPPGNNTTLPCGTAVGYAQSYKTAVGGLPCSLPGMTCLDP